MRIIRARDYYDMSRKAANIISAQVILEPASVLGLATGSTPLGIYRQLSDWYKKGDLDFSSATSINLDEYCGLGPLSPQSYRYYMEHNFFEFINILPENTLLPNGLEPDPIKECSRYDELIKRSGGIDLQLLGLGQNGHIGFNEPGTAFEKGTHLVKLTESTRKANQTFFTDGQSVPEYAYTMGIHSIMKARQILIVASGKSKAEIVKQAFCGPITPKVPASVLQLHDNVTLVGDEAALSLI